MHIAQAHLRMLLVCSRTTYNVQLCAVLFIIVAVIVVVVIIVADLCAEINKHFLLSPHIKSNLEVTEIQFTDISAYAPHAQDTHDFKGHTTCRCR